MEINVCKNCEHFQQHYVIDDQNYFTVHCGHCTYPRTKNRKPQTKACQYFTQRTIPPRLPDRKSVVHFLTTKMLQHILELPLPPEEG